VRRAPHRVRETPKVFEKLRSDVGQLRRAPERAALRSSLPGAVSAL
jgi:hypothetical protein